MTFPEYPLRQLFEVRRSRQRQVAQEYALWSTAFREAAERLQALCAEHDTLCAECDEHRPDPHLESTPMRRHKIRFVAALDEETAVLREVIDKAKHSIRELQSRGEEIRESLLQAERDFFQLESHHQEWKSEVEIVRRRAEEREEEEVALQRWRALGADEEDG